ncbi:S-adenosyl-L-methionine-dependent methyltransferase [Microdochium bolleyi]|uniref:sphingolipid C(9)-methyltransferase n=1 Tax=Microdochium bolleyi TaxID=196109 RepID=A0A136IQY3_9PEZI|nr:S-adenosyl-L-methionine-dependent methyltransferase [Microdochium bolleyi]
MGAKPVEGAELQSDVKYVPTPAAIPSKFDLKEDVGVPLTNCPSINNPPLPADGNGYEGFSNYALIGLTVGVPWYLARKVGGGLKTTIFFGLITFFPILVAVWFVSSSYTPRMNEKVKLPGRPVEHYLTFKSPEDKAKYSGRNKISMAALAEMYLDGQVDFNGDVLDILEYRHDFAHFGFTLDLFKFIIGGFFRDIIMHTKAHDESQIKPTYDTGNEHYAFFLGPRMIYTSGVISDVTREESLEELQDNKMAIVCEKIELKEGETMLDIGCGWGTLARFASVNYGAKVTGVTIASNQVLWGNDRLRNAGIPETQSKILCMDYRDIENKKYNKITQLEMGEHVGILKLTTFFRQCYDMLEDDGIMYVQLSGLRQAWQYDDFIWGLYLNKYIFPGADASTPLWNYIRSLEMAGFECKSVDTVGVHYSGTLWRWYRNWLGNKETVNAKFGARWYRIWELFLAWSVIASRQGSATCFQMVVVKNLNHVHRINGVNSQHGLHGALAASKAAGKNELDEEVF